MGKENNYRLGLYEKSMPATLSWQEKLNCVKNNGFDYLEMSIDESDEKLERLDWSLEERHQLVNLMYETQIPISSICLSGHRKYPLGSKSKEIQAKSLGIMEKAIDLASDLGVRIIQLAGYDVYYEQSDIETCTNFINNLKKSVKMASEKGVILGFETMETPFMDTVEKAMKYVNEINSAYLGIYPDIGNLKNASLLYGTSVDDDIRKGKGHIFAAHLKETVPNKYREIPFGSGHSEFVNNIQVLSQMNVNMFVGEFWYTGSVVWEQEVKKSAVFLRDKLNVALNER